MKNFNLKSGLLFATRLAFTAVFAVIFLGLIITPANAATEWHIKDDTTGGDCSLIGNWDVASKMCTLTQDLSQGIIIDSDNIVLDGAGRTITGSPTGKGVSLIERTGVTIKNLNVGEFSQGIYLYSSSNNILIGNTASNNGARGIYLENSGNNTLTSNTASSNGDTGIFLFYPSNNNTLTGNTTSNNAFAGIFILNSSNNTLAGNTTQENRFDIHIQASLDGYCNNNITSTTGSGGRPIKYFSSAVSISDETLSELILCNADGSSINNVTIDDGSATSKNNGLILNRTDFSTIANVNSSNNFNGIFLSSSNNNTLTGNTASNNAYKGIALDDGSNNNNTLAGNIASNNTNGIFIRGSSNTLAGNTASNNSTLGIYLVVASNSTLTGNTVSNNNHTGIYLDFSNDSTLTGNTVSNNNNGIYIYSSNNQIYKNNFINNSTQAVDSGGGNVFNLASLMGGNYWSNFDEPAEGCNNANGDNFCDAPYVFSVGQDNLPWTKKDGWLLPSNQPPVLSFPSTGPYAGDGIDPNKGTASSTPFFFKSIYTDADNNPPTDMVLVVDGGTTPTRYNMLLDTEAPDTLHDGNYANGEQYTSSAQFLKNEYGYHFEASDGKNSATLPAIGNKSFKSGLFVTPKKKDGANLRTTHHIYQDDSDQNPKTILYKEAIELLPLCIGDQTLNCNNGVEMYDLRTEIVRRVNPISDSGEVLCVKDASGNWGVISQNGAKQAVCIWSKEEKKYVPKTDSHYWLKVRDGSDEKYVAEDVVMTILPENQDMRVMRLVNEARGDFSDLHNFPSELFLGLIAAESGGTLNNEVTSVDSPFSGINQVHPSLSGGWNRNCTVNPSSKRDPVERNCERASNLYDWIKLDSTLPVTDIFLSPITDHSNTVRMKKNYINTRYNNTDEGIRHNISDGFNVLKDKHGSVNPCTKPTTIEGLTFSCIDKEIVKTIWAYNGFVDPSNYLSLVANNMNPSSLQNYYRGDFIDYTDLRKKMVVAQNNLNFVRKFSPVYLRVYDSHNNVVGEFSTSTQNTIEDAIYDSNTESIAILFPEGAYHYVVVGHTNGTYGLDITSTKNGTTTNFSAVSMPVATGEVHEYAVDIAALAQGLPGVTIKIDKNGDGIFEKVVTADSTLTADEFVLQTDTVVDFVPDTLNLQSKGKVVTVYIELPLGFNVSDIDPSSIRLNGTTPALAKPTSIGDYDSDGTADLMVKFDGTAVRSMLAEKHNGGIAVSGKVLHSGEYLYFLGTDSLKLVK